MQHDAHMYRAQLHLLLGDADLADRLARAAIAHRRMESALRDRLLADAPRVPLTFPHLDLAPAAYLQRNVFSILFLAVFEAVGIPEPRRGAYGEIVHGVRGIVTAADNMLDSEAKGAMKVEMPNALIMPNVLTLLIQNAVLHAALETAIPKQAVRRRAVAALLAESAAIAQEEGDEEAGVEHVLSPDEVMNSVHSYRGGRLLELAFVVPALGEPHLAEPIATARRGVGRVGLALQTLDDVTDFGLDIRERNHNLLRSVVIHDAPDGRVTDDMLAALPPGDLAAPERTFPLATARVLQRAMAYAQEGFAGVTDAGLCIAPEAGRRLVAALFRLRGIGRLWSFYEESTHVSARG